MGRIRIPAPIDVHVHLREPGYTYKEDLWTGTRAALAGGFTTVLDMPNTSPPAVTFDSWQEKRRLATEKSVCEVGFFVGAAADAPPERAVKAAPYAVGLKIYVNDTFGSLRIQDLATLRAYIRAWPGPGPVVVHAEGLMLAAVIGILATAGGRVHVAHVSRREEISLIRAAKARGLGITCEVTPHHLFLTQDDLAHLGNYGIMRPPLASPEDREALWKNLEIVDAFATDHAPHTREEKDSASPPPGVPGLETALPLLLTAVQEGRLSLEDVIERVYTRPRRIFGLPASPDTFTEVETGGKWTVGDEPFFTRAGWSPFEGMVVSARVRRTVIRGTEHFRDGRVIVPPGSGSVVMPAQRTRDR